MSLGNWMVAGSTLTQQPRHIMQSDLRGRICRANPRINVVHLLRREPQGSGPVVVFVQMEKSSRKDIHILSILIRKTIKTISILL